MDLCRYTSRLKWTVGILLLSAILFTVSSCSSLDPKDSPGPVVEGADYVGNAPCGDCHTNHVRRFLSSPHGRFYRDRGHGMAGQTGCESCHGPGSKHVAAGGGLGKFIINPNQRPDTCYLCHQEVHTAFALSAHHPVPEGRMGCSQCHDPHGFDIHKGDKGLAMARQNESCMQCHRDQTRPFLYEHAGMREGCAVCHSPHGSVNQKLLVQSDANLCLKCHSQLQFKTGAIMVGKQDHTQLMQLGTCWSSGCHTAVHGSNVNPKLQY